MNKKKIFTLIWLVLGIWWTYSSLEHALRVGWDPGNIISSFIGFLIIIWAFYSLVQN